MADASAAAWGRKVSEAAGCQGSQAAAVLCTADHLISCCYRSDALLVNDAVAEMQGGAAVALHKSHVWRYTDYGGHTAFLCSCVF
jgi:hypothetical protein